MQASSSDLRSKLSKAKGLGAAHHGVSHWWLQRVTAVAMLPLSLWFFYELLMMMRSPDVAVVAAWFASLAHAVMLILLLVATFYHAKLGMQVVIEDYVKGPVAKYSLLLANVFVCYAFATICILAVLRLHFLDISVGV